MELDKNTLQDLKDGKIQFEDLNNEYFSNGYFHCDHQQNILDLLNNNVCSFQQVVDRLTGIKDACDDGSCLWRFLRDNYLFKELIENNVLTTDDLKHLLNKIDRHSELEPLCEKLPIIKRILKEFILNNELIDKFNAIVKVRVDGIIENVRKDKEYYDSLDDEDKKEYDELNRDYIEDGIWYLRENIHTLFELLKWYATHWENNDPYDDSCGTWETIREENTDKELLELIEANKKVYRFDLNADQKSEIYELIQNNEVASKKFEEIIENHIEDSFNFDSLMQYLKKLEKKNLINI